MLGLARRGRARIGLAIAVVLMAAAACSAEGSGSSGGEQRSGTATRFAKDASPAQGKPADVAWSAKLDVIGQPVVAGPAVLVLAATRGGGVELVSLDRGSGRVNFTMPYHPGGAPTGVPLSPRVTETDAGRHVAVLRRRRLDAAGSALVAVDVKSGDIVGTAPSAVDDYDACSDGHDVCWSGYPSRPGELESGPFGTFRDVIPGAAPRRWDLETGRTTEKTLKEGALRVGDPDLFVVGEGRLATLVRLPGTRRTLWTQSVSVLVGDGVDAKYGWSFAHDADADVFIGALGQPLPPKLVRRYQRGERVSTSYASRHTVAAIDGRTGLHLWDRKGADAWCPLVRSHPETRARTLCVVSGTQVQAKGEKATTKDLEVVLQGVDPRSGEVSWTFSLAGKDAERAYLDDRAPLAPYGYVLPSDAGPVALDERTGELELVSDGTVVLCGAGPSSVPAYGRRFVAGRLYAPCDPSGRTVKGDVSAFGVSALAGTGATTFVSMPGRVVAYRVT